MNTKINLATNINKVKQIINSTDTVIFVATAVVRDERLLTTIKNFYA